MHSSKRTPPRDDAGGRGQLVPGGTPNSLHEPTAAVNLALALTQHIARARSRWIEANVHEHLHAAVFRAYQDLHRRQAILRELDRCRDAVDDLREAMQ